MQLLPTHHASLMDEAHLLMCFIHEFSGIRFPVEWKREKAAGVRVGALKDTDTGLREAKGAALTRVDESTVSDESNGCVDASTHFVRVRIAEGMVVIECCRDRHSLQRGA